MNSPFARDDQLQLLSLLEHVIRDFVSESFRITAVPIGSDGRRTGEYATSRQIDFATSLFNLGNFLRSIDKQNYELLPRTARRVIRRFDSAITSWCKRHDDEWGQLVKEDGYKTIIKRLAEHEKHKDMIFSVIRALDDNGDSVPYELAPYLAYLDRVEAEQSLPTISYEDARAIWPDLYYDKVSAPILSWSRPTFSPDERAEWMAALGEIQLSLNELRQQGAADELARAIPPAISAPQAVPPQPNNVQPAPEDLATDRRQSNANAEATPPEALVLTDRPDEASAPELLSEDLATDPQPEPAAEARPSDKGKKEPSDEAFTAYRRWKLEGIKQTRIAEMMSEELHWPVSQGQVSRWCTDVRDWLFIPGSKLPPPRCITMDPRKLEQGSRRDGGR
jgi:hypothetical protein